METFPDRNRSRRVAETKLQRTEYHLLVSRTLRCLERKINRSRSLEGVGPSGDLEQPNDSVETNGHEFFDPLARKIVRS